MTSERAGQQLTCRCWGKGGGGGATASKPLRTASPGPAFHIVALARFWFGALARHPLHGGRWQTGSHHDGTWREIISGRGWFRGFVRI